jgi:hypothetical protein
MFEVNSIKHFLNLIFLISSWIQFWFLTVFPHQVLKFLISKGFYSNSYILIMFCINSVLTEKDKNRIQAAEMRFLRSTMGVTRQGRLSNEAIRKALNVNSLNYTVSNYRDNWFNHIRQMDHSRFPRYMLSYKPTGKRSLGRPRKRWISQSEEPQQAKVQCMK